MLKINDILQAGSVIPVLTVEDAEDAAPLAEVLVGAGLRVLEVTLRTKAGIDVIRRMNTVKDAIVGAGTVLTPGDVKQAVEAGARFIVSPGLTETLARAVADAKVPFLPGVATASEVMAALEMGLTNLKFFPAETSGGAAAVKALAGPFPQCRFCPTGGITLEKAPAYLALENVVCVGGTWIAPRDAMAARDWPRIAGFARIATGLKK